MDKLSLDELRELNAMFLSGGFVLFFKLLQENFQSVTESTLLEVGEPDHDVRDLNVLRGRAFTLGEIEQFRTEIVNRIKAEDEKIISRDFHTHGWFSERPNGGGLYEGGKEYFIDPRGGV